MHSPAPVIRNILELHQKYEVCKENLLLILTVHCVDGKGAAC